MADQNKRSDENHSDNELSDLSSDAHMIMVLAAFRAMPEEMQEKCLRLSERLVALPPELQQTITVETLRYMLDNDCNYPYN
jgi:hypothetical protein